jgi:hypothetical protein
VSEGVRASVDGMPLRIEDREWKIAIFDPPFSIFGWHFFERGL